MLKRRTDWEEVRLKDCLDEIEDQMSSLIGGKVPVVKHWAYIVGPELKDTTFLESIDEHSMLVRCAHPAYASFLKLHQREIVARLKELHPEFDIRTVKVFC